MKNQQRHQRQPPGIPSTEDLEVALRVLKTLAGDEGTFPYEPALAKEAETVYKGIVRILTFRKMANEQR